MRIFTHKPLKHHVRFNLHTVEGNLDTLLFSLTHIDYYAKVELPLRWVFDIFYYNDGRTSYYPGLTIQRRQDTRHFTMTAKDYYGDEEPIYFHLSSDKLNEMGYTVRLYAMANNLYLPARKGNTFSYQLLKLRKENTL